MRMLSAPDYAMSPMKLQWREHYLTLQLEHERRGDWEKADVVNQWLTGAFTTFEDLLNDHLPRIRRHFLRRRWKNSEILENARRNLN
jgi:hypothetical protein